MPDYSLFPPDICGAIKTSLSFPIIRVIENNLEKDVPVFYTLPELDDNKVCPRLILFEESPIPDLARVQVGEKLRDNDVFDSQGNLSRTDLRSFPQPFSLDVYIRLKFKFFEHRDLVRKHIYKLFTIPRGTLTVNGIPLLISYQKEKPLLEGLDKDGNKVCQWLFSVSTYFDLGVRDTVSTVKEFNINIVGVNS